MLSNLEPKKVAKKVRHNRNFLGALVMDQCWCITIGVTCDYQNNVGSEWMGVLHKNTQYSSWQRDPSAGSYQLVMDGLAQKI